MLPVMEEFYSIQGEGFNSGKAAYFIRTGGCDVSCNWCDAKDSWDAGLFPLQNIDDVISNAIAQPAKAVVITGGEPLNYNLDYLCNRLTSEGIQIFLETSGTCKISGKFDWICLSPKRNSEPLPDFFDIVHELKVIIHEDSDFDWAEKNAKLVNKNCKLYLQPEWSKIENMMPKIIDYILKNPKWEMSLQAHKYMNIP